MEQKNSLIHLNENNNSTDLSLSQVNLSASILSNEETEDFISCDITNSIMFDPVFLPSSGNTAEKEEVIRHGQDPFSRSPIDATNLIINRSIKKMIERVLTKNPGLWENVYKSISHRENVVLAITEVDHKKLFDLLMKDPRVVYEKLIIDGGETTLLEYSVKDKKYFSCLSKIISHAKINPLGGIKTLKSIVNQRLIFADLVGQQGVDEIKLIAEAFQWNKKDYESFYLDALKQHRFYVIPFFYSKDAPVALKDLKPEGKSFLYHAVMHGSPVDLLKEFIRELSDEVLAEDFLYFVDQSDNSQSDLDGNHPGLHSLKKALSAVNAEAKLFYYYAVKHPNKINTVAKLLNWQQGFFQEAAKFIPAETPGVLTVALVHGIDPNYFYQDTKETLLCFYAINGWVQLVQKLLKVEGLRANIPTGDNNQTVLHQSVIIGRFPEVVEALLKSRKFDLWAKDTLNKTPLDYGLSNSRMMAILVPYYNMDEVFVHLIDNYYQDVKFNEYFKATGLTHAYLLEQSEKFIARKEYLRLSACVKLMADPNAIIGDMRLVSAILSDGVTCLKVLCQYNVDLHGRVNGNTLVHEAIRLNKPEVVFFLLEKGVALGGSDAKNAKGQKPEEYAKELGFDEFAGQIKTKRKKLKLEKQQEPFVKRIQELSEQNAQLNHIVAPFKKNKEKLVELMQMFKPLRNRPDHKKLGHFPYQIHAILQLSKNYLVVNSGSIVYLWNIKLENNKFFYNISGQILHFALLEQGKCFASACEKGSVSIWNSTSLEKFEIVKTYNNEGKVINLTKLSDDQLAYIVEKKNHRSVSYRLVIRSIDTEKFVEIELLSVVTAVAIFSKNNNNYIALGVKSTSLFGKPRISICQIMNDRLKEVVSVEAHSSSVTNLLYLDSGKLVSTSDEEIKIWDITDIELPLVTGKRSDLNGTVSQVKYLKNGYLALIMGKRIEIYQLEDLQHIDGYETSQIITAVAELHDHRLAYGQDTASIMNNNSSKYDLCVLTHPTTLKAHQILKEVEEDVSSACNQM